MNRWEEEDIIRHDAREKGRILALTESIRNAMSSTKQSFDKVCEILLVSPEDQAKNKGNI